MALSIGHKAPDFVAETDSGKSIKLSDFLGKWVVLYFYPKDNTSGCTREACDFRDNYERIASNDAEVIGVSPDSVKSHKNFKEKYNLNFHLVADPSKEICNSYGVLGEKIMCGKKHIGVIRSTYIIDPEGVIRWIDSNVKVDGHVDEVIAKLEQLKLNK
ncbi:MAG: peroxiredoxin [Ignavibacteria bacterium]|nr:peroxiredoxin [Ignavibacteria bacterium]